MTRQNSAHLNDFTIIGLEATPGNEATAPAVGLLYGRDVDENPAPNMRMEDVTITGKFSKACVINLASEVSSEISCIYNNEHRSLAAYAAAYVDNPDSIEDKMGGALTSEYADLPAPVLNPDDIWRASNLSHYVSQANYRRRADVTLEITGISEAATPVFSCSSASLASANLSPGKPIYLQISSTDLNWQSLDGLIKNIASINVGTGTGTFTLVGAPSTLGFDPPSFASTSTGFARNQTGPAVLVAGAHGLQSNGGYMLAYGSPCVVIDIQNAGGPRNFDMEFQQEPDVDTPILFDGNINRTIANFRCILHASSQKIPHYVIGQKGTGKLNFNGFSLNIPNLAVPPSAGLFENPDKITIKRGDIAVYTADVLTGDIPFEPERNKPIFSGTVTAYDRNPSTIFYDNAVAIGNFIDNGAFDIWQRDTSFAVGSSKPMADRWRGQRNNQTGATFSRQAGFAGSQYCLRIQRDLNNDKTNVIAWWQQIESARASQLAGRTCMLAFDCQRGAQYTGGVIVAKVYYGTHIDEARLFNQDFPQGGGHLSVNLDVPASSGVVQRVYASYEVPAVFPPPPASGGVPVIEIAIECYWQPSGTAETDDYLDITNVTFELVSSTGNGPPPFQRKTFQEELIECQRYLRKSFAYATVPAQNVGTNKGEFCFAAPVAGANFEYGPKVVFGAPMRTAPAITLFNPAPSGTSGQVRDETANTDCSSTGIDSSASDTGFRVKCTGAGGSPATAAGNVLGFHWLASCEF